MIVWEIAAGTPDHNKSLPICHWSAYCHVSAPLKVKCWVPKLFCSVKGHILAGALYNIVRVVIKSTCKRAEMCLGQLWLQRGLPKHCVYVDVSFGCTHHSCRNYTLDLICAKHRFRLYPKIQKRAKCPTTTTWLYLGSTCNDMTNLSVNVSFSMCCYGVSGSVHETPHSSKKIFYMRNTW